MANELIKAEKFNLQTLSGELAAAIEAEMDGLGTIPYDRVKIPSGGGIAFEIPTDDENNADVAKELVGVILDHHPVNARWDKDYDGSDAMPICSSYNGKEGVDTETGAVTACSECPYNEFGTGKDGSGKACKNAHRIYILREGNPVPLVLTLPPTSIKYARDYFAKSIVLKGMRCYEAVTKITLKKEESKGGITYSRVCFAFTGKLPDEQIAMTKDMSETIKGNRASIADAELQAGNADTKADKDHFVDVPDSNDGDLPFK